MSARGVVFAAATLVDRVEITWPSGQQQFLTGVAVDQVMTVREPRFALRAPAAVGGTPHLDPSVPGDGRRIYLMWLALAATPTQLLDGRFVPVAIDCLSQGTSTPGNFVLPGCLGALDAQGQGSSPLNVPNLAILYGLTCFAMAVTLDTTHFQFVRTVFPTAVPIALP